MCPSRNAIQYGTSAFTNARFRKFHLDGTIGGMHAFAIRSARPEDAAPLLDLQSALDRESRFMLLEPHERAKNPARLRERLGRTVDHSYTIVADGGAGTADATDTAADGTADRADRAEGADGAEGAEGATELAGYVEVTVLPFARARRTGYVVMGVRAAWAGQGIGKALLQAAAARARTQKLWRLELTVMTHNRRALVLYLGCGFEVEGLRRAAIDIDGTAVDEYYMGLLLSPPARG
jgi:ribosomal protein S18 acetylase RimI-like enzyme